MAGTTEITSQRGGKSPLRASADATSARDRRCALVLLGIVALVLIAASWGHLTGEFGHSHDGRNATVWGAGSRALREVGPIESRLGAVHEDGTMYANHPPLLVWSMAISEAVLGEQTTASRLPTLLSTVAAAGLLFALGVECGFRRTATTLGVTCAFLTPMVLTYGSMPDTPMLSLGPGLAIIYLWWRRWNGRNDPPWLLIAAVALGSLSGWEASALAFLAGTSLAARGRRQGDRTELLTGIAAAIAAVTATLATVAWAWWAYGSLETLLDQLVRRSGDANGATRTLALQVQSEALKSLFGFALVGLAFAFVAAIRDRRRRPLFVLVLATVFGYTTVLYNGAVFHDYWNYWFLIPIGLGVAWVGDAAQRTLEQRGVALGVGTMAICITAVGAIGICSQPPARTDIDQGMAAGRALESTMTTTQPDGAGDIGQNYGATSWIEYTTRVSSRHLSSIADLMALRGEHPSAIVLVNRDCSGLDDDGFCRSMWERVEAQDRSDGAEGWQAVSVQELLTSEP